MLEDNYFQLMLFTSLVTESCLKLYLKHIINSIYVHKAPSSAVVKIISPSSHSVPCCTDCAAEPS